MSVQHSLPYITVDLTMLSNSLILVFELYIQDLVNVLEFCKKNENNASHTIIENITSSVMSLNPVFLTKASLPTRGKKPSGRPAKALRCLFKESLGFESAVTYLHLFRISLVRVHESYSLWMSSENQLLSSVSCNLRHHF